MHLSLEEFYLYKSKYQDVSYNSYNRLADAFGITEREKYIAFLESELTTLTSCGLLKSILLENLMQAVEIGISLLRFQAVC